MNVSNCDTPCLHQQLELVPQSIAAIREDATFPEKTCLWPHDTDRSFVYIYIYILYIYIGEEDVDGIVYQSLLSRVAWLSPKPSMQEAHFLALVLQHQETENCTSYSSSSMLAALSARYTRLDKSRGSTQTKRYFIQRKEAFLTRIFMSCKVPLQSASPCPSAVCPRTGNNNNNQSPCQENTPKRNMPVRRNLTRCNNIMVP
jgi:hypothetical protein